MRRASGFLPHIAREIACVVPSVPLFPSASIPFRQTFRPSCQRSFDMASPRPFRESSVDKGQRREEPERRPWHNLKENRGNWDIKDASAMASRAVVRSDPNESMLTITLTLAGKPRNLDRPKGELLEKTLMRIKKAAESSKNTGKKKQKKKKDAVEKAHAVGSLEDETSRAIGTLAQDRSLWVGLRAGRSQEDVLVDPSSTTNEEAWKHGRLLEVGSALFSVDLNPPTVTGVEIHGHPFVGIPVVPSPALLYADVDDVDWVWYRHHRRSKSTASMKEGAWEKIEGACDRMYTPTETDLGCLLRVECIPKRTLHSSEEDRKPLMSTRISSPNSAASPGEGSVGHDGGGCDVAYGDSFLSEPHGPVLQPPEPGPGTERHDKTLSFLASPSLRVVTYNILADQYASTESARNIIFASCPSQYLDPRYRRPLVLGELLGYHPDIACLQEVDERMFSTCLEPTLSMLGFKGIYTNKAGRVREGSAMFWRKDRFRMVGRRDVVFRQLFPENSDPSTVTAAKYGPIFRDMLVSSPSLCKALQKVATIAHIALFVPSELSPSVEDLKPNGDSETMSPAVGHANHAQGVEIRSMRPFCVINTHLFFHYAAPHIRTMHVFAALLEAREVIEKALQDDDFACLCEDRHVPIVFCGDLNSDLNDGIPGAIELLRSGRLSKDHWDWYFGVHFTWDRNKSSNSDQEDSESRADDATARSSIKKHQESRTTRGISTEESGGAPTTTSLGDGVGFAEGGEIQKMIHTDVERCRPSSPRGESKHDLTLPQDEVMRLETTDRQQLSVSDEWEIVPGVDLESPFGSLASADGLRTELTNYVSGYQGLLDYIWYDPQSFEVEQLVAPPRKEALEGYLPSKRFPSDHLAVVADLRFKDSTTGRRRSEQDNFAALSAVEDQDHHAQQSQQSFSSSRFLRFPAEMYLVGEAVDAVRRGDVIAVPTDTIYGLACCANNKDAIQKIFDAKGRDEKKPVAICVADLDDVEKYARTSHLPKALLETLLPGPVTVLLPRLEDAQLAAGVTSTLGSERVGIRIPDAPFIRAICRQHRGALALTSANRSGSESPLRFGETLEVLEHCAAAFDAGVLGMERVGSTIIDLTREGEFRVIREGSGLGGTLHALTQRFFMKNTT